MNKKQWHINAYGIVTDENGFEVCECWDSDDYRATPQGKHIVKCVNEHDNLVVEVERLKQELEKTREFWYEQSVQEKELYTSRIDDLKEEVEAYKLKEKICSDCECHPEYLRWKRKNNQLKEALKELYEWAQEHITDEVEQRALKLIGGSENE